MSGDNNNPILVPIEVKSISSNLIVNILAGIAAGLFMDTAAYIMLGLFISQPFILQEISSLIGITTGIFTVIELYDL